MRTLKTKVIVILSLVLMLGIFIGCEKKDDAIKIGAILPLTGPASEFGEGNKNGIDLAVEKINNTGGLNETSLRIIYEDSQGDPKIGVNAFNKITGTEKINSLFVCMSSVSMAIKTLAEQKGLLTLCVAAAPELTTEVNNIFRLLPTTTIQAKKIAEYIASEKKDGVVISVFYIQDDFGYSFKNSFNEIANNKGLKIINENEFNKDGTNFRNIILKALNQEPNIIVLGGYGSSLGILIRQIRESGFKGPLYGTPDMGYPKVLDVAKEKLGEAYIIDFDVDEPSKDMLEFTNAYKEKFNSEPSMDAIIGYDGINLLFEAEKRLQEKQFNNLRDALTSIKKYKGIAGEIEISEDGDIIFPLKFKKL